MQRLYQNSSLPKPLIPDEGLFTNYREGGGYKTGGGGT